MIEQNLSPDHLELLDITIPQDSIVLKQVEQLRSLGIEFELNYKVAYLTWLEIRRARGAIVQSVLTPEELESGYIHERVEKKLSQEEMDKLANLTTLATVNNGILFWTQNLKPNNTLIGLQVRIIERMRNYTAGVISQDSYSRYGNAQVMYTFNNFLMSYFESGIPQADNLGDHFIFREAHPFLDGISVQELRNRTEVEGKIVVLFAAASSGVIEAGIFAHYMNAELKINTTVDPVFFNPGYNDVRVHITNSVIHRKEVIVIPFDDRILGGGYSARMTIAAAKRKYGSTSLIMPPRMENLKEIY